MREVAVPGRIAGSRSPAARSSARNSSSTPSSSLAATTRSNRPATICVSLAGAMQRPDLNPSPS
jgi:hypothetical protein